MSRRLVPLAAGAALLAASSVAAQGTRLLRHPAINGNAVAFEYGGDLWVTTRAGGPARRLTATPDVETDPHFSPDGSHIAFSRTSNGNTDVYVVSAAGGEPTRLTFHPGNDRARGWTPDGKRVVFASDRASAPQSSYFRMFTVPAGGGFEEALPMPRAFTGTHSPDGARVAFEEISTAFIPDWYETSMWRHYRGGRVHPISIIDLATCAVEKLPWQNSNDSDPMWIGNTVYFLSDRNYTRNLFSYNLATKKLEQLTHHDDADIMTASAGSDAIVYEQNGVIHLFDLKTGQSKALAIDVVGDFPWARPQFKRVASMIRDASLSPTGVRAAFEARGDIFTVPADKGDWRNLTKSPGAHDRNPVWSPDGAQLAWLSDAKGDDQLMIADQSGLSTPRAIPLPGSGLFLGARVVAERKAAARRRQSSEPVDRRRRDGQGDEARRGRVQHAGPELPGHVVAGLAMGRVHEEPRQPHARRLRALARRAAVPATHRRARRRHVAGLRRERQVSLLPRQHRLRSEVRLGRDERRRSPVAAVGVSRGAQRERPVAPPARDG